MHSNFLTLEKYGRAEALADGLLVDVTDQARLVGFKVPVAMSCAAWSQAVEWTHADNLRQGHQDQAGRLWDVLTLCFDAARISDTNTLTFRLHCIPRTGERKPVLMVLQAEIAGDDHGMPAVTIRLPGEG